MAEYDRIPVEPLLGDVGVGDFANALRVLPDTGSECLLDFCVYSSAENTAQVVARIRVHRSFLPLLEQRIREASKELSRADALMYCVPAVG